MSVIVYLLVAINLNLVLPSSANSDTSYFDAAAGLEDLLNLEISYLEHLDGYIKNTEIQLRHLKMQYADYKKEHNIAVNNGSSYFSNPINAFKIITRLNIDWTYSLNIMTTHNNYLNELVNSMIGLKHMFVYPTYEDVHEASDALIRLQELYNMNTTDIAEGIVNGEKYSSSLTSRECYEVGRQSFVLKNYYLALEWFQESFTRYSLEEFPVIMKEDILDYLSSSSFFIGKISDALMYLKELALLQPHCPLVRDHMKEYEDMDKRIKNGETIYLHMPQEEYKIIHRKEVYDILCRNEMDLAESVKKDLKCRYLKKHHPFLLLAPLKMEEYYLDPFVAVLHDVIYDKEIELIKSMAKPKLHRSAVRNTDDGSDTYSKYRTSKTGWLSDNEHQVLERLSQRTHDITGLSLDFSEPFQVANYGIGGHYEPHFDFSQNGDNHIGNDGRGNRIATVLYYMTNVTQGGNTVFPELGVTVRPLKGSALFWWNLHPSGEGNIATLHGACPVLVGEKWISNKWFRQKGQELRYPCNLEYQSEDTFKDYPQPIMKKL